jgi:hypothetical protein
MAHQQPAYRAPAPPGGAAGGLGPCRRYAPRQLLLRAARFLAAVSLAAGVAPTALADEALARALESILASHAAARAHCERFAGNARVLCFADAEAQAQSARETAQAQLGGTAADQYEASLASAAARFDAARLRCEVGPQSPREACLAAARQDAVAARERAEKWQERLRSAEPRQ